MTTKKSNLPVWLTAFDAYWRCLVNLPTLSRVALIPSCLALLAGIVIGFVAAITGHANLIEAPFSDLNLLGQGIARIFWIIFAVAWHRFVLLGPSRARTTVGIDLTQRELIFFAYASVILFISVAPYYAVVTRIIAPVDWLVLILLYWPWLVLPVAARMVLVLPAAAIERRFSFGQAWTMTRGTTWRVVAIMVLCGSPLAILLQVMYRPLVLSVMDSFPLLMLVEVATVIITFLQIAVFAAGLSLTYRWISQRGEQEAFR